MSRDRALQRASAGVAEIRGDCLDCRSSLKDASNAGMTLTVCVIKSNGTMILDDEQAEVTVVSHSPPAFFHFSNKLILRKL